MTEKRFILDEYLEIGSVVIDTENENVRFNHENKLSMKQCCDLLNEQHETIQELIQSSKELEEDCQSTFNAMSGKQDDLYRKNFKLKEENEELKQYKQSVSDVLLSWSQKSLSAKQLQVVIAIMEELNVMSDLE